MSISIADAIRAGALPGSDKDPFDRVLIAQSLVEEVAIVTRDSWFRKYAIKRVW